MYSLLKHNRHHQRCNGHNDSDDIDRINNWIDFDLLNTIDLYAVNKLYLNAKRTTFYLIIKGM